MLINLPSLQLWIEACTPPLGMLNAGKATFLVLCRPAKLLADDMVHNYYMFYKD